MAIPSKKTICWALLVRILTFFRGETNHIAALITYFQKMYYKLTFWLRIALQDEVVSAPSAVDSVVR